MAEIHKDVTTRKNAKKIYLPLTEICPICFIPSHLGRADTP